MTADDSQGAVFKVSTKDASCGSTSIPLQPGWTRLGMGFSTDVSGGTSETLYVAATGNGITIPPIPGFDRAIVIPCVCAKDSTPMIAWLNVSTSEYLSKCI